jgi:hypothetical protein
VFGIDERGDYVGSEEEKTWEKEAAVPLGPYGLQMYENRPYLTHVNPHAPSEMDGREVGQKNY